MTLLVLLNETSCAMHVACLSRFLFAVCCLWLFCVSFLGTCSSWVWRKQEKEKPECMGFRLKVLQARYVCFQEIHWIKGALAKVSDLFSIDSLASLQPMYIVFSVRSNTKLLVFQSWPHHERVDVLRSALCCANKWNVVTTEFIHSRDANVSDTCIMTISKLGFSYVQSSIV